MEYCGLDLGRKSSRYCVVDDHKHIIWQGNVRQTQEHLRSVFRSGLPMRVIVEATTQAFWTADLLRELGHDVRVVDPNRTKAIGAALIPATRPDAAGSPNTATAKLDGRSPWPRAQFCSAKATVRSNNGGDNWPLASGARKPAVPSHAAWQRFCGPCGRTKRRSTGVYPPGIPRTTRSVTVPYSNPSTWCSAYPTCPGRPTEDGTLIARTLRPASCARAT